MTSSVSTHVHHEKRDTPPKHERATVPSRPRFYDSVLHIPCKSLHVRPLYPGITDTTAGTAPVEQRQIYASMRVPLDVRADADALPVQSEPYLY